MVMIAMMTARIIRQNGNSWAQVKSYGKPLMIRRAASLGPEGKRISFMFASIPNSWLGHICLKASFLLFPKLSSDDRTPFGILARKRLT